MSRSIKGQLLKGNKKFNNGLVFPKDYFGCETLIIGEQRCIVTGTLFAQVWVFAKLLIKLEVL